MFANSKSFQKMHLSGLLIKFVFKFWLHSKFKLQITNSLIQAVARIQIHFPSSRHNSQMGCVGPPSPLAPGADLQAPTCIKAPALHNYMVSFFLCQPLFLNCEKNLFQFFRWTCLNKNWITIKGLFINDVIT